MFRNGDIVFIFINANIIEDYSNDALHDNELISGISDAFVEDTYLHIYHEVMVPVSKVKSGMVAIFKSKPTCNQQENCLQCIVLRQESNFQCNWCPLAQR